MHTVTSSSAQPPQPPKDRELPDLSEPDTEGERISVTDVNGTVARFEMTYSAPTTERVKFEAPLRQRVPSFLYLAVALVVVGLVVWGYNAPSTSRIFTWVVQGDRSRPLSSQVLAAIVGVSALATVLRAHMRGVVISADWIEARYLLPLGIPKTSRWGWPQVNRIILDKKSIAIELMDGSWERFPEVADLAGLRAFMLAHAVKRKIDVTELERSA